MNWFKQNWQKLFIVIGITLITYGVFHFSFGSRGEGFCIVGLSDCDTGSSYYYHEDIIELISFGVVLTTLGIVYRKNLNSKSSFQ